MRIPPVGSIPELLAALRARLRRDLPRLKEAVGRGSDRLGPFVQRLRPAAGRLRREARSLGRDARRRLGPEAQRLRREAARIRVDAGRIRSGERAFFSSRLSLLAGLALALLGTFGAVVWSLASGEPYRGINGTVVAGEAHGADPATLLLTAPRTFVIPGDAPNLLWPTVGRAAIEVEGMGLLGHEGGMTARAAIASITKTMTAYVVLEDHPLGAHDSGPTIVVTSTMARLYGQAIAKDESAVPLKAGERLTERQALEAMLLASAGDMADLLALWDRGSVHAFAAAMNTRARVLGLSSATDYTDPTGLAASTVSTMADQLKLAEAVQKVPALTAIVAERSAQIPVAGTVQNINQDLGYLGVDGIKTGTTAAAGSCLLFSAHVVVGGRTLTLLGIVLGMPGSTGTPWAALKAALALLQSAETALRSATVAAPGTAIAALEQDGSRLGTLGVSAPLTVVGWGGLEFRLAVGGNLASPRLTVTQTDGSGSPLTAALARLPAAAATPGKSSTPAQSATPASP